MVARDRLAAVGVLALLLGAALPAAGHGPPPPQLYDPLTHAFDYWLAGGGALAAQPPQPAAQALPTGNGTSAASPLLWQVTLPVAATLLGGVGTHLVLQASGVVLGRPTDHALLQVEAALDGQPINGSASVVSAPEEPLQPNKVYALDVRTGPAPLAAKAGDAVGVLVSFLGLALEGAPALVLGPQGSTANATFRVPSLDALGHDHPGWQHVGLDDFYNRLQVTNEPVLDVDVHGGTLEPVTQLAPAGETLTVRIITDYTPQDGAAFGPWGLDNPLAVHMTGLGLDERFHLYPGEVLLRAFRLASGALEFACTSCNSTAPFATLQVSGDPNGTGSAPALSQRAHLDPGKFTEVNLQLKKGESFQWSFTTDPPTVLHYDVHSHVGSQVTTHLQGDNETANGTFTAPFDGIFSLFLDNSNPSPVDVLYQVEGGTPYVPKSFLPGPPEALALVALGALALALRRR